MKYIKIFEVNTIDTNSFEYISSLSGTTTVELYIDKNTNKKYVVKYGANQKHMYNEYLANKLYHKYGIKTPVSFIGVMKNKKVLVTEYLEDSIPLDVAIETNPNVLKEVNKGFIFDVLFGNYDVFGSDYNIENIRVLPNGDVYRVDLGGSLLYRAQGKKKKKIQSHADNYKIFNDIPLELDTLRDPLKTLHDIFFNISDEDIKKDILYLSKKYVIDNKLNIKKYLSEIHDIIFDKDIKMKKEDKKYLIKTLFNRALFLHNKFNGV
jgi:hypothetical protein